MIDDIGKVLSQVHRKKNLSANYNDYVEYAKEMAVHAYGAKPKRLLEDFRPREEEAVRQYRLDSYEPITQSYFDDCVDILQKMFEEKRYSIEFNDTQLSEYMQKDFPYYDHFIKFCRETLLKFILSDPNGLVCVEPIPMDQAETERTFPFVYLYASDQVLDYQISQYAIVKLSEKHYYENGKEGDVYKIYQQNITLKYGHQMASGGGDKWILLEAVDYNEFWPDEPVFAVWKAGGVPILKNQELYFESFFNKVIPPWNKAIRHESDLDGAYVNHLHVQKWYAAVECDYMTQDNIACNHGILYKEDGSKDTCPSCNGSGTIVKTGPYNDIRVQVDKLSDNTPLPPVGFIAPPIDAAKMLEERVKHLIEQGLRAINMEVVSDTPLNQSGTAKEIDRSQMYDTIKKISDYMFDNHVDNIIYYCYKYRYGTDQGQRAVDPRKYYEIHKPIEFNSMTASELTAELANANNVDVRARKAIQLEFIRKRFPYTDYAKQMIEAILLDPFYGMNIDEKLSLKASGTVTEEDMIISNNITYFIEKAFEENKNFDKINTFGEKYKILLKYALEKQPNIPEFATGGIIEKDQQFN